MEELYSFICKPCGAQLDLRTAVDGVLKCEFCGNTYTVHKPETSREAIGFLQIGEHDLDMCKFGDAFMAYKKASELNENEPEAYFGMALAELKVQYVKNEVSKRLQPIWHMGSDKIIEAKKFSDNKYYQMALEKATPSQREEYVKRAEDIDRIRSEFLKLRDKGVSYDCFICVKVGDDHGGKTSDQLIADEIYTDLKRRGYKPFFSERELEKQTGSDYEAVILYALYTAECMFVVCTNEEYLNSPWVKNEYTRYLSMISDERKESDSITIVFKGNPIEYLPGKKGKIQGINRASLDAVNRIRDYVDAHSPEGRRRREEEAAKKAEEERRIREEQEQFRRQVEEQNKKFEERLRNLNNSSASSGTATVNSLIMRANQFLKDGDIDNAKAYFNRALDADPQSGEAWWGLFLCEMGGCPENIIAYLTLANYNTIKKSKNYANAKEYASEEFMPTITKFSNILDSSATHWKLFLEGMGARNTNPNKSGFADIIKRLTPKLLGAIEKNEHYIQACKKASDDEAMQSIIKAFQEELYSGEGWLKRFFESVNASDEKEFFRKNNTYTYLPLNGNEYFMTAERYAQGDTKKRIENIRNKVLTFDFMYKCFLNTYGVETEYQLLSKLNKIGDIVNIPQNEYFGAAKLMANDEQRQKVDAFLEKIEEMVDNYNKAIDYVKLMMEDFGCKTESELHSIKSDVSKNKNFIMACECAKLSQDEEYYSKLLSFGEFQQSNAAINRSMSRKHKTKVASTIIGVIALILNIAFVVGTILSWCKVGPLGEYWFVWANSIAGNWLTTLLFIASLFGIMLGGFLLAVEANGVWKSLYLLVFLAIIGSGVVFNLPSMREKSNLYFADDHIIAFKNQDDEYAVSGFYYKGKSSEAEEFTLVIPEEHNEKKVIAIRKNVFKKSNVLYSVVLPDSIETIEKKAFYRCRNLVSISLGSGLKKIDKKAIGYCQKMRTINYNGTKLQWKSIDKYYKAGTFFSDTMTWDYNSNLYTIYCTDGPIKD